MRKSTYTFWILGLLLTVTTSFLHGQINIKVGYNLAYVIDDKIEDIVDRYNLDRPFLNQELGDLEWMGGIDLGLRYRLGRTAIEFSWINNGARSRGYGNDGNIPVEEKYEASLRTFSLGLETMYGAVGFGTSIDRRRLNLKLDVPNFDATEVIQSSSGWAAKFHLALEAKSKRMSMTFKPYFSLPLSSLNVYNLEKRLFPDTQAVESDFDTDFSTFGIAIVIYNGPQN